MSGVLGSTGVGVGGGLLQGGAGQGMPPSSGWTCWSKATPHPGQAALVLLIVGAGACSMGGSQGASLPAARGSASPNEGLGWHLQVALDGVCEPATSTSVCFLFKPPRSQTLGPFPGRDDRAGPWVWAVWPGLGLWSHILGTARKQNCL